MGKSTLLARLALRGHLTVDTDDDGWTLPNGLWDAARMSALLADHPAVCVSGTVENQVRFYDRFDHVVLLSAPVDVLLRRLQDRRNNPYGKTDADRADVRRYIIEVEPLLRRGATAELDARLPVDVLADSVEALIGTTH